MRTVRFQQVDGEPVRLLQQRFIQRVILKYQNGLKQPETFTYLTNTLYFMQRGIFIGLQFEILSLQRLQPGAGCLICRHTHTQRHRIDQQADPFLYPLNGGGTSGYGDAEYDIATTTTA